MLLKTFLLKFDSNIRWIKYGKYDIYILRVSRLNIYSNPITIHTYTNLIHVLNKAFEHNVEEVGDVNIGFIVGYNGTAYDVNQINMCVVYDIEAKYNLIDLKKLPNAIEIELINVEVSDKLTNFAEIQQIMYNIHERVRFGNKDAEHYLKQ